MTQANKQKDLEDALDIFQIGLAATGDRQAFDLLYRRWHPRLLRLARRLTRHEDEAQDVMQEAALTIARDIHKLRDPASFSAWAYTIVRRRTADHISKAVRHRNAIADAPTVQSGPDDTDMFSIRQAFAKLPETDRFILTLFHLDGLTGREISAALNVPVGTVKSRLFKARARLKTLFTAPEGDRDDL